MNVQAGGWTALAYASVGSHVKVIDCLLDHGADVTKVKTIIELVHII